MVINHLDTSTSPQASFEERCTRGFAADAVVEEETVISGAQKRLDRAVRRA